jgi:hypothetical protein
MGKNPLKDHIETSEDVMDIPYSDLVLSILDTVIRMQSRLDDIDTKLEKLSNRLDSIEGE